ncbi:tRNA lysidine(34) synthetase TilS [Hoeflea olei]|uniref:tRNA(Ile)-lysidine synthase n=1 Tax=Hoeflea olei TaxID=1480615 RepID=A0A1C1Z0K8_9HYPH|nr:tRNA lysidine(34) synthetase TilS [Hoeflea olei]OCW59293.1 hypothetical protein AWJ14_09605 [Hoeflea olei]
MPEGADRAPPLPPDLERSLTRFLHALDDDRPLGVAVSGGSDSLGLLTALASLLPPRRLVALTVDHGLRPASAEEARRVKAQCRSLGLRHETLRWDGPRPTSGLQAAARAARYRLLGTAAGRLGLAAVLTAHTRDDQCETLAMRRARSPSDAAAGLAGIPPATLFDGRLWVLRPLLDISRATIRAHLSARRIAWIDDPSNADPRFERVRVRAALEAGPADPADLAAAAGIAAARGALARAAAAYIRSAAEVEHGGQVRIGLPREAGPAVITAGLEALIDLCGGAARPLDRRGKATLRAAVHGWIGEGTGAADTLTLGRALLRRRGGALVIARENRGLGILRLDPGGSGVWDGRFLVRNLDRHAGLIVGVGREPGNPPLFGRDCGGVLQTSSEDWQQGLRRWREDEAVAGGFVCRRLAGRASRILPVHEWPLAQALAELVGCATFPPPPVTFSDRATASGCVTLR